MNGQALTTQSSWDKYTFTTFARATFTAIDNETTLLLSTRQIYGKLKVHLN
jgi:hypothetical protein